MEDAILKAESIAYEPTSDVSWDDSVTKLTKLKL